MKFAFTLVSFFCMITCAVAQLTVTKITVHGNKKTKQATIIREMDISVGDTIPLQQLNTRIQENWKLLIGTGLFLTVEIRTTNQTATTAELAVTVKEDWYIYPIPIVELADRNFNEWWKTYNRDLKRLNLGLRFYWLNTTGRNDQLKLVTQFGFTQKYELDYRVPFFNRKKTLGARINTLYARTKEVNLKTDHNKTVFFRQDNNYLLKRIRLGTRFWYRPKVREKLELRIRYYNNQIQDTIQKVSPEFFNNSTLSQEYLSFRLRFISDHRDLRAYPMKGFYSATTIQKDGIGLFKSVNSMTASSLLAVYFPLPMKFSVELIARGQASLIRQQQPFYQLQQALGYGGNFVRGYEYYVIDGLDFGYQKTSIRYELFNKDITINAIPFEGFKTIPLKLYLKLNNDFGYVNNPYGETSNSLENKLLWGGGPGLDLVLYHRYVVQFEFSINRFNEKGLYLHYQFLF